MNSPCVEDPKVMEGHNTCRTSDWGLYNITIQQYHTLKVLFVRQIHRCWGLLSGPQATHPEDAACMTQSRLGIAVSLLIQLIIENRLFNYCSGTPLPPSSFIAEEALWWIIFSNFTSAPTFHTPFQLTFFQLQTLSHSFQNHREFLSLLFFC